MTDTLPVKPPPRSLQILSILHYLLAALKGVIVLGWVPIALMLLMMASDRELCPAALCTPDRVFLFQVAVIVVFGVMCMLPMGFGILQWMVGRQLARCEGWVFCVIVSILECVVFPTTGLIVGVITLIILCKGEIKSLFTEPAQS